MLARKGINLNSEKNEDVKKSLDQTFYKKIISEYPWATAIAKKKFAVDIVKIQKLSTSMIADTHSLAEQCNDKYL